MTSRFTTTPLSESALRLLGNRVRAGRIARKWTVEELAKRVGVSHATIRKVESGDPSVRIGTAFDAAALTGVPLFAPDESELNREYVRSVEALSLLPKAARLPRSIDDDF